MVYFLQVDDVGVELFYCVGEVVDFQLVCWFQVLYVFVDVVGGYM